MVNFTVFRTDFAPCLPQSIAKLTQRDAAKPARKLGD